MGESETREKDLDERNLFWLCRLLLVGAAHIGIIGCMHLFTKVWRSLVQVPTTFTVFLFQLGERGRSFLGV
jgi:hypothetical protein